MARRHISKTLFDAIVLAYREEGVIHARVAKKAGVDRRTAWKAWEKGWPEQGFESVRDIFEKEHQKARAQLLVEQSQRRAEEQKEREDAIKQAAQSRAEEGEIVSLVRSEALQLLRSISAMTPVTTALSAYVNESLMELVRLPVGHEDAPAPGPIIQHLNRIVDLATKINAAAHEALVLERIHLGEPTQVGQVILKADMTLEEAEIRLQAAKSAVEGAKKAGGFQVIDGGLAEPEIGRRVVGR